MTEETTTFRRHLVALTVVPGWVLLALVTLVFALGASLPLRYQFVPLVASVAVLGLPHGAVDHLAVTRVRGSDPTPQTLARVGVLYAVLGTLYAAAWFVAPVPSFVFFILLTWAHWGQGEVHSLVAVLDLDHITGRPQRLLTAAARGALPMLVPLVAFPAQYRFVAETLVGLFAAPTLGWADAAFTPTGRTAVAAAVTALFLVSLSLGAVQSETRRDWVVDAGEVALLASFFAVVPPVLAVGLYFTLWHSLRHIGRLLAIDSAARAALSDGKYGAALARFVRDATPLTAMSVLILGVFYLLVPTSQSEVSTLVAVYLVLIAALTLPHVVVVSWLDREQRVWTTGPALLVERR